MQGIYFYGDECTGRIWGLKRNGAVWENSLLVDSPFSIASFGEDEAGELYLADYVAGDIYRITAPATGDFDGDGKTDIAVYRVSTGAWWIIPSSGAPAYGIGWGGPGFTPVPGDYDGDGKTDIAIYNTTARRLVDHPLFGRWRLRSRLGWVSFQTCSRGL